MRPCFPIIHSILYIILGTCVAGAACGQVASSADGSAAFRSAKARQRDAETLKTLSGEGQLLYQRDAVKLNGYQYCSQAVALAERGELRESIRAASRALYVGQQQGDDELQAVSRRDFAIAYSYAGDLDRAEQYAKQALQYKTKEPSMVAAPAYKVLGDVAVRRNKPAEAIAFYNQSLQVASDRFRPLVQLSLANTYITEGKPKEARVQFDGIAEPSAPGLRQLYRRSLGSLLLAEGKPAEALKHFQATAAEASGTDAAYHRLWALEGTGRCYLALKDRAAARRAYVEAADTADKVRAQFRSEEFKTGLFGDMQQIFERALALSMEAGDGEAGWALSEASRSRALLDVVRERAPVGAAVPSSTLSTDPVALDAVRAALRDGEAIVEYTLWTSGFMRG